MIRFIIVLILVILALSYFGISIRDIAQSPTGEDNFTFVMQYVKDGWEILTALVAALIEGVRGVFS